MRIWSLLVAFFTLQGCSELMFYPVPGLPFTPAAHGLDYRDQYLRAADGTRLHAWWLPVPANMAVRGTLLHLHGNAGNLSYHLAAVAWLPDQGYQVLMLDYRGYGLSEGTPSLPAVYQDIGAAFDWLEQAEAVQGRPLFVLGQSLGGAMGAHYLAAQPHVRERLGGLVLDGVPASYRGVARDALASSPLTWPLQVPLSWLVPDAGSAVDAVPQLAGLPLLILHSVDDAVVPLSNGRRLYQAARPPRVFQPTRGGHVQTFDQVEWRHMLLRFMADPQALAAERETAEVSEIESLL